MATNINFLRTYINQMGKYNLYIYTIRLRYKYQKPKKRESNKKYTFSNLCCSLTNFLDTSSVLRCNLSLSRLQEKHAT